MLVRCRVRKRIEQLASDMDNLHHSELCYNEDVSAFNSESRLSPRVCCAVCAVYCVWCAVLCLVCCTVFAVLCTVCAVLCTVFGVLYCVWCAVLCLVCCTVFAVLYCVCCVVLCLLCCVIRSVLHLHPSDRSLQPCCPLLNVFRAVLATGECTECASDRRVY